MPGRTMRAPPRAFLTPLALVALAALSGCGSSDRTAGSGSQTYAPTTATVAPVAPQGAVSGTSSAPAGPKVTAAELQSMLANNTATGVSRSGGTYYAWFGPTGQIRFVEGDVRDTGTWRVLPDGQLCSQMTRINADAEQCYTIYRNGAGYTYDRPDGTPLGSFMTLQGNPQNL